MGVQLIEAQTSTFSTVDIDLVAGSHNYTVLCVSFVWANSDTVSKSVAPTLQSSSFTLRASQTVTDYFGGVGDVAVGVWLWSFSNPSVGSGPYTVSFGSYTGDDAFNIVYVLSNSDYAGSFNNSQATPGSSYQQFTGGSFTKQGALFLHASGHISEADIRYTDPTYLPNENSYIHGTGTKFTASGEGTVYGRLYSALKRHRGATHDTEITGYHFGVGSGTIWANCRLDIDTKRFDQ